MTTLHGKVALVAGAILSSASPSPDDLRLLTMRKPQIDFDDSRAQQRARIEAFLRKHERSAGPSS